MAYCSQCGTQLEPVARSCQACGAPTSAAFSQPTRLFSPPILLGGGVLLGIALVAVLLLVRPGGRPAEGPSVEQNRTDLMGQLMFCAGVGAWQYASPSEILDGP